MQQGSGRSFRFRPSALLGLRKDLRTFIVDSGASFHLIDPKDLTTAERRTIRKLSNPEFMQGAGGEVCADEAADVYVVELDVTVEALLLQDSPTVLSLGQLCDHDGFNFHWLSRKPAYLEREGQIFHCQPIHDVPYITSAATPTSVQPV